MANEQQGQDAAWNDFLEAKRRLLQSMLDFIQAAEKAFEGHVWITLGYPEGMISDKPKLSKATRPSQAAYRHGRRDGARQAIGLKETGQAGNWTLEK